VNVSELYQKACEQFGFEEREPVPYVVSTGSLLLDRAIGVGGYPGGRVVEVYGPEGAGKTTLGLTAMVQAQALSMSVALIDMERALDEHYARSLGIQGERNKDWLHFTPDTGEECIDLIQMLAREGVQMIVIDSVAAMVPKAEFEGATGEAFMGLQARMMGQAMRKLTGVIYEAKAVVIFINQVRSKIGVFFGPSEVTTGGRALRFYASLSIEVRGGEKFDEASGRNIKAKITKNKVGMPFRQVEIPLVFGRGIDRAGELLQMLQLEGLVTKRSSFFYFKNKKIGAGAEDTKKTIREDIETYLEALQEIKK